MKRHEAELVTYGSSLPNEYTYAVVDACRDKSLSIIEAFRMIDMYKIFFSNHPEAYDLYK